MRRLPLCSTPARPQRTVSTFERRDYICSSYAGHVAETFLAGDIPKLESDDGPSIVPIEDFQSKVDADGRLVVGRENVVDVSTKQQK